MNIKKVLVLSVCCVHCVMPMKQQRVLSDLQQKEKKLYSNFTLKNKGSDSEMSHLMRQQEHSVSIPVTRELRTDNPSVSMSSPTRVYAFYRLGLCCMGLAVAATAFTAVSVIFAIQKVNKQ